jgi:hypothetical protein
MFLYSSSALKQGHALAANLKWGYILALGYLLFSSFSNTNKEVF